MSVQEAVDELATSLGLSVLVEDLRQHPVWWCTVGLVDEVRAGTILDRRVERSAAAVVRDLGLRRATRPVRTPAMPERGMWARWAVPVRHGGHQVGLLWILDPDDAVDAEDLAAAVEVATLAAAEIAERSATSQDHRSTRDLLLSRLLEGPDPAAAGELAALEQLAVPALVQVDAPAKPGGWQLPDDMSAHPARARRRVATSGAPIPLVDLTEAVRRARATRRALAAGAILGTQSYDVLGAWLLVVEAPESLQPTDVHPAVQVLTTQRSTDLLDTARTVLDLGGDVSTAAEVLHVHRTTLYYRLERIRELTGVDLRRARERTHLQLALWLRAYRTTEP